MNGSNGLSIIRKSYRISAAVAEQRAAMTNLKDCMTETRDSLRRCELRDALAKDIKKNYKEYIQNVTEILDHLERAKRLLAEATAKIEDAAQIVLLDKALIWFTMMCGIHTFRILHLASRLNQYIYS